MNQHTFEFEQEQDKKLAMWFFIAAEVVIFASLFGVFLTLRSHVSDGPSSEQMLEVKSVVLSTVLLLSSSFTIYACVHTLERGKTRLTLLLLLMTFLLGGAFLMMESREFLHYYEKGYTLDISPFVSSFYLLVGTHGLHVLAGVIWMGILMIHVALKGVSRENASRLSVFSLYWHFVDLVWVLIFTLVYLYGKVG
ncbi:cytochrome o ubiquinol oxidase subunit III [Bacillus sp. AFS015802]|uniref:cytochrome c oxidase subunit 3 n=1 Tax=Bacillus sp. AFS015802 TaxID=2033486 RepID=UPI000BF95668|nr:cytochrome c oxidase subunit 3 [Bacillus sp. AFS015802]PFA62843.1 cytochrome o ubiquinol oxidase subunit III [Bacillus sp. AFS015802]